MNLNRADPPQFSRMDASRFEELICALLDKEPEVQKTELFAVNFERQFGVDCFGSTKNGIIVVSCKCYSRTSPRNIFQWSDEFLNHWTLVWAPRKVTKFILATASNASSVSVLREIDVQRERFALLGIEYEVWSPRQLQEMLRPHPGIVSQFLGADWVKILVGKEFAVRTRTPNVPTFWNVPPKTNAFTGRNRQLADLASALDNRRAAAITTLSGRATIFGLGGVGKTSIATEYAHRNRKKYKGVWWCAAATRNGLLSSLAELAARIDPTSKRLSTLQAAKNAVDYAGSSRGSWLLIYDNVTKPDDVIDLLPAGSSRVLITSRFTDWNVWATEIEVDVWDQISAIAFLETRVGRTDPEGAAKLAEALGWLPLALDHAAAICKRSGTSFQAISEQVLLLIEACPAGTAYLRSVSATFQLAIEETLKATPDAEILICFLAQCAPEQIPLNSLDIAIPDAALRTATIAALAEVSLIKLQPFSDGTAAVSIHRLVQTVANNRPMATQLRRILSEKLIARLADLYPTDSYANPASWPLCAKLTPHVLNWAERSLPIDGKIPLAPKLLNAAGSYLQAHALFDQALPLRQTALDLRIFTLGEMHADTATSLNDLALLRYEQGNYSLARPMYRRAFQIRRRLFGLQHLETAESLNNVGMLLWEQSLPRRAEPFLKAALQIRYDKLGPESRLTAQSFNNLGLVYYEIGLHGASLLCFETALSIREKILDPADPAIAETLNNTANLLRRMGQPLKALPISRRAWKLWENALGARHPLPNRGKANLARLLALIGSAAEAKGLASEALINLQRVYGEQSSWAQHCRETIALAETKLSDASVNET